ncbi:hypothetical protein DFS34DRAFT_654520 [Phlyctochytrium arcticum]|nr:hypothetical protein DFS34DRAFT_654520 [Phlyctochytrium arcticum]
MKTHYETLEVQPTATLIEIRKQFQRLALVFHPDKVVGTGDTNSHELETINKRFQEISAAWKILQDEGRRALYDEHLRGLPMQKPGPVHDEIDLDDMDYDEGSGAFHYGCRCGDTYCVTEKELEEGVDFVSCGACSLRIRILYHVDDG